MKSLKLFLIAIMTLLTSTACNGNKTTAEAPTADTVKTSLSGKALVVFFSHAGENYAVGNVEVGNTKIVADYICEKTGADQFEIVCTKDYNMAYKPLCDLAKKEKETGELPDFIGEIKNIDDYSIIFIGGPVWWGTYPQVMFSFFKKYDLNGKTLVPFTTHEGSGLGECVEDVQKSYPEATVLKGFSIYGHEVRTEEGKKQIADWLNTLQL